MHAYMYQQANSQCTRSMIQLSVLDSRKETVERSAYTISIATICIVIWRICDANIAVIAG